MPSEATAACDVSLIGGFDSAKGSEVMRISRIGMILSFGLLIAMPCLADPGKPLTNADVVQMVKAGLPESTILLSIKSSPAEFDTTPTSLIALKNAGVTPPVLDAMLAHGATELPPGAIVPSASTVSDHAAMVGPQGLVAIDGDRRVELYMVAQYAFKPKMKLWSNEQVAILSGDRAKIRLTSRSPAFDVGMAPNVDPEKMIRLMKMKVRGDTREASLRVTSFDTLARKVPTVTEGVVETTLTQAPGASPNAIMKTYRLTPNAPLEPGEYMVVQYDSQMWDFGVD